MATVVGLTATRVLALIASTVIGGHIDGNGHLILETQGGEEIDAGAAGGGGAVQSVNGETGAVELSAADVGAIGSSASVQNIVVLSQTQYDGLNPKVATTLYIIQG